MYSSGGQNHNKNITTLLSKLIKELEINRYNSTIFYNISDNIILEIKHMISY